MDVSPVLVADLQAPDAVEPEERPFTLLRSAMREMAHILLIPCLPAENRI